jgi:hypothetical protein
MNTPILFLIFNRIDTTQKVFDVIRGIKPKLLFVAADGPRVGREGEKEKCEEVRNIIKQVDWDCEVKTLYRGENLGCGKAVSGAITWFFENVEEGIILEDDCLPDISFFQYCEELLEKYRLEDKVYMISGNNFLPEYLKLNESYYFSNYPHIWGWATWRRAWKEYSFDMDGLSLFIRENKIARISTQREIRKYYLEKFKEVKDGKIDTWDYQWTYTIWNNKAYSISPNDNLISNIGFGLAGTHTMNINDSFANLPISKMKFPLVPYSKGIYSKGDEYESSILINMNYKISKILKYLGLFQIAKYFYSKLKNII